MKDLLKLLFVLFFIIGCTPEEDEPIEACVFEDENITWLNEKIEDFEKSASSIAVEIYQYTYQEETVFLTNDCVNCSDALEKVYNCAGEVICEFGGITGLNTCIDFDTATDKVLVYTNINNQVIIDNDRYTNTSTENYQITNVSINGDILKLSIQSSGCSGDTWQSNLIDSSEILESLPVQRNIKIDFINNEECEALITKEYEFDISSLQVNGEEIVHFNIEGWTETVVYNYGEASTEESIETCVFEDGNITWLNEKIDDLKKSNNANETEIYQYTYNEETVFLIKNCINCSDALDVVYNCVGEVICEFGGIAGLNTCIDFNTATNKTLVYTNTNNQVIIDNDRYINTSTESYQITNVSIDGDILKLSIKAGGCSGDLWEVNLIDSSNVLESLPVQRNIKIDFINDEECEALITKEYEFDISSLQVNGEEIVHFNLEGWTETIVYN